MKRTNTRWAAVFLVCLALVVGSNANAADPAHKFTRIIPQNPNAEATIASRAAEGARLHNGIMGDWRTSRFRQSVNTARPIFGASSGAKTRSGAQAGGASLSGLATSLPPGSLPDPTTGLALNAATTRAARNALAAIPRAADAPTASTTFGGFMDPKLYQVIDPNAPNYDYLINLATVDVNNDGHPDIVHMGWSGNLYVQLNDGKGGFELPVINTGGQQYVSQGDGQGDHLVYITPADVNGDGKVDLVVTEWGSYQHTDPPALLIFLNQGGGHFSDPIVVNLGLNQNERPGGILVTDRDGDGIPDILLVSYDEIDKTFDQYGTPTSFDTNIKVRTLFGNGDGTFQSAGQVTQFTYSNFAVIIPNGGAHFVTLAGTPYLAIEAGVYTIGYNGTGSALPISAGASVLFFQDTKGGRSSQPVASAPSNEIDIGSNYPYALTYQSGLSFADTNGDGLPDLTLSFGDYYLYGAPGTADGGFAAPQILESGTVQFLPFSWSMADVNGDGIPDLIDMEYFSLEVWLGNGDGTFADPKMSYTVDPQYTGVAGNEPGNLLAVADFDGDGVLDFGTIAWWGVTSVAKGYGDGTFSAPPAFAAPNGNPTVNAATSLSVLDLNGDGLSDLVALNGYTGGLASAISDGKGHLTYNSYALPADEGIIDYGFGTAAVADFNNDGYPDLLMKGEKISGYDMGVALSKHDGTFANPITLGLDFAAFPKMTLTGDINHDGKIDIVSLYCSDHRGTPAGFWVQKGNGDGTFQNGIFSPFGTCPTYGVLADVNGDGQLDLIVADSRTSNITMIPGHGTGSFDTASATTIASSFPIYKMVSLDANNDGHLDLAVIGNMYGGAPPGITIFIGAGDGTFTTLPSFNTDTTDTDMVTADFNGDGCADLFTAGPNSWGSTLTLGNCDGTFQAPQTLYVPVGSSGLHVGTFTADGAPSVLGTSGWGVPIFILYNQAGTKGSLTASSAAITEGAMVTFTAGVQSSWAHRPIPTGTFSFYDNGTLLGNQSVAAGGADFQTSALSVGSHTITASYSGDENYNARKNLGYVNVSVAAPAPPAIEPGIGISSPVPNMVLNRGESKTAAFTIAGTSNYTGNVTFSVSGANGGLGVSVNPTTVSLVNGSPATISVTVTTVRDAATATAKSMSGLLGTLGATALSLVFLGVPRRKRRSLWICLYFVLCMGGLGLTILGCSGGSSRTAKAGVSTIVVTATPSVSGATSQTTSFTVTVQ